MKRIFSGISALLLTLIACRTFLPNFNNTITTTPNVRASETFAQDTATPIPLHNTQTATPTVSLTVTSQPTSTRTPTSAPATSTATPIPTTTPAEPVFEVRTHPDGGLFVGDQVSFEVISPPDNELKDGVLSISNPFDDGPPLEAQFAPFGISGRNQATLYWGWDTSDLEAGTYPLSFSIQPLGITWTHTVILESAAQIPPPELLATWRTEESNCCVFHYITETAAAREITTTLKTSDELAEQVASTLKVDFTEPLVVTLMSRVLGQGGFASSEVYISLLDRNYAGNSFEMVLNHELVHILDYRLGGDFRPTLLIEGLAVYLSGGHYKPEALIPRAAVLLAPIDRDDGLGLGWYLPLKQLSNDFYNAQHEIGYIQAGALVEYMVDTWGWDAYSDFYRDIHPIPNGTQADALDAALLVHFNLNLETLESNFLDMLRTQSVTEETLDDVRLTVEFFDTIRRYQQTLDPSAYFLTAWLPDGPLMRENKIVADLVRRPSEPENIALETLLVASNQALKTGDYTAVEETLEAVNAVLDNIETGQVNPFDSHPLAKAHYEITVQLQETGYQVEGIKMEDGKAQVVASQGWPELFRFVFAADDNHWVLTNSQ